MLAVGASAADVTATVLRVAGAYGPQDCQVDVTFTSLLVSYDREGAVPLTAMRSVRVHGMDHARLQGIAEVARAAGAGELSVEESHRRLDVVVSAPPTYRRTVPPSDGSAWRRRWRSCSGVAGWWRSPPR